MLESLPSLLQAAQAGLLQALHAIGLVGTADGQPAWPFASRIAAETLVIDQGLSRQVALSVAALVLVVALLLVGIGWRRPRWPVWGGALAIALLAPWPSPSLVLTPAVPTSFHRSPSGFDTASIERGLALYNAHCLRCHGADGRGEGPEAASLPVWPPTLGAGLLWKRAEGELYWRVQHGMARSDGVPTMPGFEHTLSPDDTWAVLDGMKALAAGEAARRDGNWPWPVRAPEVAVHCAGDGGTTRPLSAWRGQRLRLVVAGGVLPEPIEDPRFVTVVIGRSGPGADCTATSAAAASAYARIAGDAAGAGQQFIVDRDGWLRALGKPGNGGWSEDSVLCRSDGGTPAAATGTAPTGLDALIARMDADPVRTARLGLPHAR